MSFNEGGVSNMFGKLLADFVVCCYMFMFVLTMF